MKGDFSRVSFDPRHHFSQVLLQQGRVTLDADPNEQGAILLHYLRTLARDLFGAYGGPVDHLGFGLQIDASGEAPVLRIDAGRYYVDGILCENEGCDYGNQPYYRPQPSDEQHSGDALSDWLQSRERGDQRYWLYLDVWERHVTAIEYPHLRETALGGPDTCSRLQVVWQVRALDLASLPKRLDARSARLKQRLEHTQDPHERERLERALERAQRASEALQEEGGDVCSAPLEALARDALPQLAARVDPGQRLDDPCLAAPDAAYRGVENNLYRVEIHRGSDNGAQPTFKWSRDNGSVASACLSAQGERMQLATTRGFAAGQWVELSDERDDLQARPGALYLIDAIDGDALLLDGALAWDTDAVHPKLRRWDQSAYGDVTLVDGAVPIPAAKDAQAQWIDLEDGVQIRFAADADYRSGDYWLIPARVASGGIDWPTLADGSATAQPPRGIEHHYAPLGVLGIQATGGGIGVTQSCSCSVTPMNSCSLGGERDALPRGGGNGNATPGKKNPAKPKPHT